MINFKIKNYKIIQKPNQIFIFQGLSLDSINFLRNKGLWLPVNDELLNVDKVLGTTQCQLYLENINSKELLYIITEYGEYMTGKVYDTIDHTGPPSSDMYLHTYNLYDGTEVKESIQAIVYGIVFLHLEDVNGNFVSGWSTEDMDYILKPQ